MNTQQLNETTGGTLTDVAVLDVVRTPGLMEELLPAFLRHRPAANEWPAELREKIQFRTECRWGRVEIDPATVFLVNELGEGPREPLSPTALCRISIYAELPAGRDREGFADHEPFIDVAFDAEQARAIPSVGFVRLDEFLLRRLEGVERAWQEWRRILDGLRPPVASGGVEEARVEVPLRRVRTQPQAAR